MDNLTTDLTAGRTAHEIAEHPELEHPIHDVTDPRSGDAAPRGRARSRPRLRAFVITDPTDPRAGHSRG